MTQAGGEREPEVKETARARQGAWKRLERAQELLLARGQRSFRKRGKTAVEKDLSQTAERPQRCSQEPEGDAEARGPRGVWRGAGTPYRSSAQGQSDGWSWQP